MDDNSFAATPLHPPNATVLPLWIAALFIALLILGTGISACAWLLLRKYRQSGSSTYARMDLEEVEMQVIDPLRNVSQSIIPEIVYRSNSTQRTTLPYDAEICPWCLNEIGDGELLLSLPPCGHVFRSHCIAPYLPHVTTCPCCRRFIASTDEDHTPL